MFWVFLRFRAVHGLQRRLREVQAVIDREKELIGQYIIRATNITAVRLNHQFNRTGMAHLARCSLADSGIFYSHEIDELVAAYITGES